MAGALAIVGGVVGAISSVGSVVASVVGAVSGVVASVVGSILTAVGSVTTALTTSLGGAVKTIGGIVEALSAGVQGAVSVIRTTIAEPLANIIDGLGTAIGKIAEAITAPFEPILSPIKDSLISIKDLAVDVNVWVKTQLSPVGELISVVNTLSAINLMKQLIEGNMSISALLGKVQEHAGRNTVKAIAILFNEITNVAVNTIKHTQIQTANLAKAIDDMDERIVEDNKTALAALKSTLDTDIKQVTIALADRIAPVESQVNVIARRTEDLPYFQDMLIKALS